MTESNPVIIDGRYRVLERIGSGGMAEVFCAEDLQLGRRVAVKVLHRRFAEDPGFVERFRLEASSAAGLSHPNIVSVYDRGEWDGTFYIAMEYLGGRTLKEIVEQEGPLAPARAVGYARQILAAAGFAHSRSIIHRDLKPQNVIVAPDGSLKVTDFGIAKAGGAGVTETGSMVGTAQYVAPEQAEGKAVSAPSDLYSVGVILYELLTGRVPFDGESAIAIALKHTQEAPVPPSQLQPGIPPALERVVLTAMAKLPEQRYPNADAFLKALDAAGADPQNAPPLEAEPVLAEERSMSRWWLAVVAGVLVLGALVLYLLLSTGEQKTVPSVVGVPQAEAQLQLKRAGFATDAQTKTSDTVRAGIVIATDPAGGEQAEEGSTVTVTVSSGPGVERVPDLVGRPRSEAIAELEKRGFEVAEERQASEQVGANRVVDTRPQAGQELERGQTVTLVISSGKPQVTVPSVTGQSLDDARTELESAGFTVSVTRKEDAEADPGTVLSQTPQGGSRAARGSAVALTVAREPAAKTVPDVTGQPADAAAKTLRDAGFAVEQTEEPTDDPALDGKVISQNPTGQARGGATVTIVIGRSTDTETTTTTETTP